MERPGRIQFMLGRVVLYSDHINAHKRPDSSRPQAARSRVATRVSGEEAGTARHCSAPIINIAANGDNRRAVLGYMERPGRVQFMLGRVGLYSDHINAHNRPDSSRPQAARSRVATRVSGEEAALRLAGRVGLYSDDTCSLNRPDSKRPQALKSRVATRGAERKPHCGWPAGSGCTAMISICTIVQTRAARKRRGVGLHAR